MPNGHTLCYAKIAVKYFDWDDAKNEKLKAERGIGFEDVVFHIERGDLLDILEHPNVNRYAGQRVVVVRREDYVYLVHRFAGVFTVDLPYGLNAVVQWERTTTGGDGASEGD